MGFEKWIADNEDELYCMYTESGAIFDTEYQRFLECEYEASIVETIALGKVDMNNILDDLLKSDSLSYIHASLEKLYFIINGKKYEQDYE
jgi:hypothetical protein